MVVGLDAGSQDGGGKEKQGKERRIALCEAADHVIGGENRWVFDGVVEREGVVKWGCWGERKEAEEVGKEGRVGGVAGDDDVSMGLLGLAEGRARWECRDK